MTRSASHFCFVVFPPQSLLDVHESQVMKRTSISYCAMWENSRADILGSKTSQCEVLGLWARVQLHKTTRIASRFSIYTALLDVLESRVMKRTSISYWAVWENSHVDKVRKGLAFAIWSPISRERQKTKTDSRCVLTPKS